ncbi:MAG: secretin N-terminal domain-containing protein [Bdellovibrio sp.]
MIRSARNIQRDGIEVLTELPPARPERMVTWIVTLKNASVEKVNRDLRILTSKDGEMSIFMDTNQLYISDFTSNLYRIKKILDRLDQPVPPAIAKIVKEGEVDRKKNKSDRVDRREAKSPDRP